MMRYLPDMLPAESADMSRDARAVSQWLLCAAKFEVPPTSSELHTLACRVSNIAHRIATASRERTAA